MPCRCAVNTLGLFIRSIAQVDLSATTQITASRFPIRSFGTGTTSASETSRRAFSTATASSIHGSIDRPIAVESNSTSGLLTEGHDQSQPGTYDTDSAIVDFSPDAIDAIAAELLTPQQAAEQYGAPSKEYETPLNDLLKDLPSKKPKPSASPAARATLGRTQRENTSFTLHFSSPRRNDPNLKENSNTSSRSTSRDEWTPPEREHWMIDKAANEKKYPDGWNPRKKLSPDAMVGIRALHAQMPERYTTEALAEEFKVTPEAIRRILKSKWTPSPEEETDRQRRWLERGKKVWSRWADLGEKPPKAWREMGIGNGRPEWRYRKRDWAQGQQGRRTLPALITSARAREAKYGVDGTEATSRSSSLADRIL